jgi:hypothetical protein
MSIANGIVTAGAVVGIGAGAFIAYQAVQRAKLTGDLKAAGTDPAAIQAVLAQWRQAGGTGREASVAIGSTENVDAGAQGLETQRSVSKYVDMGIIIAAPANLTVVKPWSRDDMWRRGEAPWLPGQPGTERWHQDPTARARGFQLGEIAFTYLPDCYPASGDGVRVVAYHASRGYVRQRWYVDRGPVGSSRGGFWTDLGVYPLASADGEAHAYDVFVSSTGGGAASVCLWSRQSLRFLRPDEARSVQWAIADGRSGAGSKGVREPRDYRGRGYLNSKFAPLFMTALARKVVLDPTAGLRATNAAGGAA